MSGSAARTLAVTYANDSDDPITLGYEVFVAAEAAELLTVPPPVDEPAGAVLLLAGAGLAGWRLRRR